MPCFALDMSHRLVAVIGMIVGPVVVMVMVRDIIFVELGMLFIAQRNVQRLASLRHRQQNLSKRRHDAKKCD